MSTTTDRPLPWHLTGNFAPVADEVTLTDLEVLGAIPAELDGLFVRNGANPRTGTSPHWFFGNGMLHGVRLSGGRAEWYRNRYVRTPMWDKPDTPFVRADGTIDRHASAANTHVIEHSGRILCLEEGHFPWEVNAELETVGVHDFAGKLNTAMTAHPKLCPETGELLFFGYNFMQPYLTYHRADAAGNLVQSTDIAVAGPTMMHDFNATRNHVIFMDLPVVFDLEAAMRGSMPFAWSDTYGARLGVLPRNGSADQVRWYEIEPCYVFHPMNAHELGDGSIQLEVGRYQSMWRQGSEQFDSVSLLHRFTIDPASGKVHEEQLDDRPMEFARVADARVGLEYRFGYATATRPGNGEAVFASELLKYDLASGGTEVHDCGPGRKPGEGVYAATGPGEDGGFVLTFVYDGPTDTSELVIVDAQNFAGAPVARVKLPRRVPFGFHGSWLPS